MATIDTTMKATAPEHTFATYGATSSGLEGQNHLGNVLERKWEVLNKMNTSNRLFAEIVMAREKVLSQRKNLVVERQRLRQRNILYKRMRALFMDVAYAPRLPDVSGTQRAIDKLELISNWIDAQRKLQALRKEVLRQEDTLSLSEYILTCLEEDMYSLMDGLGRERHCCSHDAQEVYEQSDFNHPHWDQTVHQERWLGRIDERTLADGNLTDSNDSKIKIQRRKIILIYDDPGRSATTIQTGIDPEYSATKVPLLGQPNWRQSTILRDDNLGDETPKRRLKRSLEDWFALSDPYPDGSCRVFASSAGTSCSCTATQPFVALQYLSQRSPYRLPKSLILMVVLLGLCRRVNAQDTPNQQPASASFFSLIMATLSLSFPVIRKDPRTSLPMLYATYLGSLLATAGYGYVCFPALGDRQMAVLLTVGLSSFGTLVVFASSQEGSEAALTFMPLILSLAAFTVGNLPAIQTYTVGVIRALRELVGTTIEWLWGYSKTTTRYCLQATGLCIERAGRRVQGIATRRRGDLEQGQELLSHASPGPE